MSLGERGWRADFGSKRPGADRQQCAKKPEVEFHLGGDITGPNQKRNPGWMAPLAWAGKAIGKKEKVAELEFFGTLPAHL